jgi:hypothetical protein
MHHRAEVLASERCGCFSCLAIFPPSAILNWTDTHETMPLGNTALCPRCGIDAVIGSESGYPVTTAFLRGMLEHWFDEGARDDGNGK